VRVEVLQKANASVHVAKTKKAGSKLERGRGREQQCTEGTPIRMPARGLSEDEEDDRSSPS
jgi:hypothetical protein